MKFVYFGTGSFAVPTLRALKEHIVLVVSQPDRPSGRGLKTHPSETKLAAIELGIPVETPEKARAPEFVERIQALDADALIVASYGQILSQRLLDSARRGGINLHGSLLPKYRGAAPIQRCLFDGETETGVTLMQMDKGMDTGDMIAIERTPIAPEETYGELQDRLSEIAARMAVEWAPRIVAGDYPRQTQDHERATLAPKVDRQECELSFERDASAEFNRYRAFTPAPGVFVRTHLGILKLGRLALRKEAVGEPGQIVATGDGAIIAFQNGGIEFLEVQPEGKRRMSARDFLNGARLKAGASLR